VILLDTNALIWVAGGHRRTAPLLAEHRPLYVSPASFLELQLLVETGRVRLRVDSIDRVAADPRWAVDDPSAVDWFQRAWPLSWTRDPFDRLLVAHARLRGWKLATADEHLLAHLHASERIPL
jgi:PIN domain nuclease of toxin-antitoxin system